MLKIFYSIVLVIIINSLSISQITYSGPLTSSVDTGAIVNTGTFADAPILNDIDPIIRGEMTNGLYGEPNIIESNNSNVFPVTYVEDNVSSDNPNLIGDSSMLLNKWDVQLDNNVIPPDPTCAVGPNHVMVLTNNGVGIRIYDKQGNLLKSISSDQWWSAVWPNQLGDPQIIYDHYAGRWVMVFMQVDDVAFTAGDLIAYSDDSDPLGTWYMYRLPSTLWGDYPQIGFDNEAIYIATNNFTFTGQGQYAKIRIISKNELYSSNAGHLSYKDIWNISLPNSGVGAWNLRPSFQYTPTDGHYLVYASRTGGIFYAIYKLSNPTTTPSLTAVKITVPFYGEAPMANQLGGGTPLIESGGSPIRTAPIFRDGYLYCTHSIRNTVYPTNSSVKYFKVDVSNNTIVESAELGAQNYFYLYPTLTVDKDGNVFITYSRSATTEYCGAYYSCRRVDDPAGLGTSRGLQVGLGNYVKTFGGTNPRNRWGDYMGIFLDPADEYSAWMFTEYAYTGNNYATVVGQVRLKPFPGAYVFSETDYLDFGDVEVGFESEVHSIVLKNYGDSAWVINDIPDSSNNFLLTSIHSLPVTVQPLDSIVISLKYKPSDSTYVDDYYLLDNNSTNFPGIRVKAVGYIVNPVQTDKIYAISGEQNGSNIVIIDKITGYGNNLGSTGYTSFISNAINPKTKIMYALESNSSIAKLYRINGTGGDAYFYKEIPIPNLFSITFDTTGQLYANNISGTLFSISLADTGFSQISQIPVQRVAIAVNPLTNEFWGSIKNVLGIKDRIIKFNHLTGDTIIVGQTGFGINSNSLVFDGNGFLYSITGTATSNNNFIEIDTTNAHGTIIGATGIFDLKSLAMVSTKITNINNNDSWIPANFELSQNYPNPFNPSTQIKFALPVSANVKITIYNLLGEVVKQLASKDLNAGNHSVQWNADDSYGNKVSSGIYFYELNANGEDGSRFKQVRKMMLLK